jgi:acyl carrier protein
MPDMNLFPQLEQKIVAILRKLLMIEDDIELNPKADLVQQIGLDSIEAFDAVAVLHEIIGQAIPPTFNPKTSNSVERLSLYVLEQFGEEAAQKIIAVDVEELNMAEDDSL